MVVGWTLHLGRIRHMRGRYCTFEQFHANRSRKDGPMRASRMISAVDLHACCEPGRVITGGVLDVPGATMFEKKTFLEQHADGLRKLMLREPRGYPAVDVVQIRGDVEFVVL
jgi:Proline racemase